LNRPSATQTIPTRIVANGAIRTAFHDVGHDIGYDVGAGDAAPFVLVHGFTGSKLDFRDQLSWFAHGRRVLAPDQRGHGETSHARPYRLQQLVDDLLGFLDAAGIARCHLLGHSMGGMVAMRFAVEHGARLESLILMDTSAEPLKMMSAATREATNRAVLEQGLPSLVPMFKSAPRSASALRGIDYLGEEEHWRRIETKLAQMDPNAFVDFARELGETPSVLADLAKIRCRTTVLVGVDDVPFVEPSARMAATIPNAALVRIDEAAHSPQYENADAWRNAIEAHLDSSRPSRSRV